MSKYTTGEIAKLCGVSVRTVQYYDSRNILIPSELSDGGRRLYSEQDLHRMKIICFLRELDISINTISQLLVEDHPENIIELFLKQQESLLRNEINEKRLKLSKIEQLQRGLKTVKNFSIESIGDIAYLMENKKNMRQLHTIMLLTGIPLSILQLTTIIIWIIYGIWWPFVIWLIIDIPYAIWMTNFYFKRVAYICPQCHGVFKPKFKEAFWAKHTPTLRKLTCSCCGYKGFCVEIYKKDENSKQ